MTQTQHSSTVEYSYQKWQQTCFTKISLPLPANC